MNLADPVSIPEGVMARQVGEETVILDLASGNYFGLNAVGSRLWLGLAAGKTPGEVCDLVMTEFDVKRPELEADMSAILRELMSQGLLQPSAVGRHE